MGGPAVIHLQEFLRSGENNNSRSDPQPLRAQVQFALPLMISIVLCCLSCGGQASSSSSSPPMVVTVSPRSAQPFTGEQVQFTATAQNSAGEKFIWEVNSQANGNSTVGTISSSGLYTSPSTVPNPPTVTVTAVLQSDPAESGSSIVTIESPSGIQGSLQVVPHLSSLTTSQTLQLEVNTAGVSNSDVTWSVDGVPNGNATTGTISSGLYSPPNATGGHLITAALKSNPGVVGSAQVEVTDFAGTFTWRNDNSRSGQNTKELALAPATVSASTFGKLFSCPLDSQAYAQPLYAANLDTSAAGGGTRNVVFVATEKDSVYAFDADAQPCVQLWHTNLVPAGEQAVATPNLQITTAGISPFVGITGTPVIDPDSSTLYVVAKTETTASTNPVYHQRLYALELATGQPKIQPGGVDITTPVSVTPAFNAVLENQRGALLLDNQIIYVAFGSYQDLGDYHGWVLGYDSSTLQQVFVLDDTPGGTQGGIWQSGGGPSADSNHDVFVITGNGTFDADRGGQNYGDSFLRLIDAGSGTIADYFTPCDQSALSSTGEDLGASAPLLLPNSAGSAAMPNLLLGGGKNGSLYLLNRDNLGGYNGVCPDSTTRVQTVPVGDGPIFSTPLFWNGLVYVAAGNGNLKAYSLSNGLLGQSPLVTQSPETLGSLGATPVLSSNGADNAVLWLIDTSGTSASPSAPGILRAFDPTNLSTELYNSAMNRSRDTAGPAVKFTIPTVANGKVYIGTQGELDVYGLLPQ